LSPRAAAVACVVTACALASPPARANAPDAFGFGSRGAAMGGAVAADTADVSAGYYNPAGLALAKRLELSLGYMRADHSLAIDGKDSGVDPVRGLATGVVAPGAIAGVPFAFGVALFLPDDRIERVRALPQSEPRWELYDNRNQRLMLLANVAVSPLPWLQIGGGLSFMAATEGSIGITGQANIFDVQSSQLRHEIDADTTSVRYPQAGIRIAPLENLAFALVYRGEFRLRLDLTATLQGDISGLTTAYYQLVTHSVNNFLPQQVVLGGTWEPLPGLKTNLDLTWVNWSAYVAPTADIKVALDIPPPAGGWPPTITPPTLPAPSPLEPIVMHDRVVPHVGVEWRALGDRDARWQAFVRGGYEYDKSPVGAQTGATSYVDRDRHAFSLGLGGRARDLLPELPRDLRLDLHAQLGVLPTSTTQKTSPADFVGDYTAGGHIWNVGATLTAGF
jgi:long-chain fatty acid transport protein